MTTKLILYHDTVYLLKNTGELLKVSLRVARDFLLNYGSSEYNNNGVVAVETPIRENDIRDCIIADITTEGHLLIKNPTLFKKIIEDGEADYLSVTQFADHTGLNVSTVRRYCQLNKIPGVRQLGNSYFIPSDATLPGKE